MKLIIEDDEGRKTVVPFVREEITIGRQEGNTIRLTERNVSRHHARLLQQDGQVVVEDLGSYNGIRVNGERIQGQASVNDGDLIQIGDYDLAIHSEQSASPSGPHELSALQRAALAEPETEADAPIVADSADLDAMGYENTSPSVRREDGAARHHSTSVIHVSQVSGTPARKLVELEPEEAPRLFVLNTPYGGREFACIRSELRVGRADDNDIAIDHRSLSRTHAKVVREDNGEWRVLDLQSANGLKVNGETYAQVTLRSGDVIELGHVKLKFLAPGDTFRYVPGAYDDAAPRGGKRLPLIIALCLLAMVAGALAVPQVRAALGLGGKPTDTGTPTTSLPNGSKPVGPKPNPDPASSSGGTPTVPDAGLTQKVQAARSAMEARDFDKAVDVLESAHNPDGSRPKDVEDLLKQARQESTAHRALNQANKDFTAGRLESAAEDLKQASSTVAFASEYEQLKAKLDAAQKPHTPQPANGRTSEKSAPATTSGAERARSLLEEGMALLKKKQYEEAVELLEKCLEADPKLARCHMYLGSAYARLRKPELGAQHYRMFLKLAPDDPQAQTVQGHLDAYEHHP